MDIAQNAQNTVILAADEASLYLQASLMRVWSAIGQTPVVKVVANRNNTHFYGALNLQTGQQVMMRSDLMNADVTALFLNRILLTYSDVPILLLWDRATWHKGEAIRSVLAANPRLELWCFPPGCPELNPQEHVWKATREAVSHNHNKTKLLELADAFGNHLNSTCFPCSFLDKFAHSDLCAMFK